MSLATSVGKKNCYYFPIPPVASPLAIVNDVSAEETPPHRMTNRTAAASDKRQQQKLEKVEF